MLIDANHQSGGIVVKDKYIDLSKHLLEERNTYVKYREEAVRLSTSVIIAS